MPRAVPRVVLRPAPAVVLRGVVLALLLVACSVTTGRVAAVAPASASPLSDGLVGDPHVPGWAPDLGLRVSYAAPAPGRILRAFDPPRTAFSGGHRGVDLELAPGASVRAAGSGRVTFAGPVAGRRWVSIAHPDGHMTTYGPLADLQVRAGEQVRRGDHLAVLAGGGHGAGGRDRGVHWGARDATGAYVDPLGLLGGDPRRASLVGEGRWAGTDHAVTPYQPWPGGTMSGVFTGSSPVAQRPGFAVPPNPNHLILLPGLATDSRTEVLEATDLGYDPRSVTAFSYAGRTASSGAADDPRRDQLPYGPQHTWDGPGPAAARLAEQLRAQAAREPGRAVDLIGHSLGGLVIWRYLVEHHDPYDRSLPPIGHVITINSPLRGSDLAVVGEVLGEDVLFGELAEDAQRALGDRGVRLPLDVPAIGQLASGSDHVLALAEAWEDALEAGPSGPLATGTRLLTIAGSRDVVVTPHRARHPASAHSAHGLGGRFEQDGEVVVEHRVLPGGHSSVLETEAVREVAWRFLAGEEVVTSPGHAGTVIGGELGNAAATAARAVHLWGLWRGPLARRAPLPDASPRPSSAGAGQPPLGR
ncbi:MAG: peptidoglycan DD-metalloendopeptidase family protein [Nitriliruptoraceae bacterium]